MAFPFSSEEFGDEERDTRGKPSSLDKIGWAALGTVAGNLPPRAQLKITGGDKDRAAVMSGTSRIVNGVISLAAIASGVCKLAGVDIDPCPYDFTTYAGLAVAADSLVREGRVVLQGMAYAIAGGERFMEYNCVWGSPTLCAIDKKLNPEKYTEKL